MIFKVFLTIHQVAKIVFTTQFVYTLLIKLIFPKNIHTFDKPALTNFYSAVKNPIFAPFQICHLESRVIFSWRLSFPKRVPPPSLEPFFIMSGTIDKNDKMSLKFNL